MPERESLRILVVDDDEAILRLVETILVNAGFAPPAAARNGAEALQSLGDAEIVLLDYHLPDMSGMQLLPLFRARPTPPAVIMFTGHGNESLAAAALRNGAEDYLIKDASLAELLPQVLERVRRDRALRQALAAAERDLVHAERRAAIGQMNVTLHHTINNPLMAATIEAELLLQDGQGLTTQQSESVQAILNALRKIGEIVQRASTLQHDATEEYLDGLSMIDLSRRTQPAPLQRGPAAIYVHDEDIARVIGLLLRHAGFSVERAPDLDALRAAASRLGMSVVVLAGAPAGAGDPLGGFRPESGRGYFLVALVAGDGSAARAAGADHVVGLPFDPGTFVSDLLAVMKP